MPTKTFFILLLAGLLSGCFPIGLGVRHYYGTYDVSCDAAVGKTASVARLAAARLGRQLVAFGPLEPDGLDFQLQSPSSPSILLWFSPRAPGRFWIAVRANNPEEDESIRAVRRVIDAALLENGCPDWRYNVTHTSLTGG